MEWAVDAELTSKSVISGIHIGISILILFSLLRILLNSPHFDDFGITTHANFLIAHILFAIVFTLPYEGGLKDPYQSEHNLVEILNKLGEVFCNIAFMVQALSWRQIYLHACLCSKDRVGVGECEGYLQLETRAWWRMAVYTFVIVLVSIGGMMDIFISGKRGVLFYGLRGLPFILVFIGLFVSMVRMMKMLFQTQRHRYGQVVVAYSMTTATIGVLIITFITCDVYRSLHTLILITRVPFQPDIFSLLISIIFSLWPIILLVINYQFVTMVTYIQSETQFDMPDFKSSFIHSNPLYSCLHPDLQYENDNDLEQESARSINRQKEYDQLVHEAEQIGDELRDQMVQHESDQIQQLKMKREKSDRSTESGMFLIDHSKKRYELNNMSVELQKAAGEWYQDDYTEDCHNIRVSSIQTYEESYNRNSEFLTNNWNPK